MGKFRDHTIEEKRKLRNARQKRKRKQRVLEKKRLEGLKSQKLYEDQLKREAKLRETLRGYCRQWRQKCVENNRLKERLKKSTLRPEGVILNKGTVNNISSTELVAIKQSSCLGEGSFGQCFLRTFSRLSIPVVEKQMPTSSVSDIMKEAHIMQEVSHANIPTILGVQLEKKPYSIVMEFIGEQNQSFPVCKLLKMNVLDGRGWIRISFNVADALFHLHKKGFLHCDLKSNNIIVSNGKGYLIDFGKVCTITSPSAKKYDKIYPHIAPEVLRGSPCSKQSDIYSLGIVLKKIGAMKCIFTLTNLANKCLSNNPHERITLTGLMTTLSTQNEFPLEN